MTHSTAQRRLVKSPPELWAEVSSADSLGRHLAGFGEIRITRVEPETTVAWEGDRASGTVELQAAGWGTKVILTASPVAQRPAPPPVVVGRAPAQPRQEPAPQRPGFFARLFRRPSKTPHLPLNPAPPALGIPTPPVPTPDPSPPAPGPGPTPPAPVPGPSGPVPVPDPVPPSPDPEPPAPPSIGPPPDLPPAAASARPSLDAAQTMSILTEVLDDLGAAHHRPFSREQGADQR